MHNKHPTRQTKQLELYKLTRMCLSKSEIKMETNAREREVHVHRLSPEILSVWWPCWTAWASAPKKSAAAEAAARMAMAKTHRLIFFWTPPLPTSHFLFPVSTRYLCLYSPPPNPLYLPVWSGLMSQAIPQGVIKEEEIPANGKLFGQFFSSYQAAFGVEREGERWLS